MKKLILMNPESLIHRYNYNVLVHVPLNILKKKIIIFLS